jgi:hypothetical protein
MKLTKTLMCAMAVGAMAFATDQAQASSKLVIDGSLYVPINIKGTFSYVNSAGKIVKKTATSKQVLSQFTYAKGTMLAIGPGITDDTDVYAINNGVVLADLTTLGYFSFSTDDIIDTSTGDFPTTKGTYTEAGVATLDFASSADLEVLDDNDVAFNLTGTYLYKESDSAVVSDLYKSSIKFSSKNLSGMAWVTVPIDLGTVPVSGSVSGSGSGPGVIY